MFEKITRDVAWALGFVSHCVLSGSLLAMPFVVLINMSPPMMFFWVHLVVTVMTLCLVELARRVVDGE